MEKNQPSPHIKDHYEVVGVEPGIVQARDGKMVDLTSVTLERAHELHEQKFPFLKPIGAKKVTQEKVIPPAQDETGNNGTAENNSASNGETIPGNTPPAGKSISTKK